MLLRIWKICVSSVLVGLTATSFAQVQCESKLPPSLLVKQGVLTTAINPTVAPLQYIDDQGKLVGTNVDFGNAIAQHLCLKMEFASTRFETMIPGLKDGRFDMIDTFMYYTPERASQVIMIPYGAATLAIVVPAENADAIKNLEYFSGKRFAVQLGSIDEKNAREASAALVASGKPPVDIRSFPNYSDILQTLRAGQVDGGFVQTEQSYYYHKQGATFFRIAATGLYPHTEALAFRNLEVANLVAAALNEMKKNGKLDSIFSADHQCLLPPPYKITTGPIDTPKCTS